MPIPVKRPPLFWLLVLLVPLFAGVASGQSIDQLVDAAPKILEAYASRSTDGYGPAAAFMSRWKNGTPLAAGESPIFTTPCFSHQECQFAPRILDVEHELIWNRMRRRVPGLNPVLQFTREQQARMHGLQIRKFPAVIPESQIRGKSADFAEMPLQGYASHGAFLSNVVGHLESSVLFRPIDVGASPWEITMGNSFVVLVAPHGYTKPSKWTTTNRQCRITELRHRVNGLYITVAGRFDAREWRSFGYYNTANRGFSSTPADGFVGLSTVEMLAWKTAHRKGRGFLWVALWELDLEDQGMEVDIYTNGSEAGGPVSYYSIDTVRRAANGAILNQRTLMP